MKKFRVLLDLDCVLCDFIGGVCSRWGVTPEFLTEHWTPGTYGMNAPLAKSLQLDNGMTDEKFWGRLNRDAGFWANLAPLPWFDDLLTLVKGYTDDWHVISSPSFCETSYSGKVTWLKRMFGSKFNHFALTPHKEIFAQPGVVLIDDYEVNCGKFRNAGGTAILFPCHHNELHRLKNDPMPHVRESLELYALQQG